MYDNANDAYRYLQGTVVYWNGTPVYVSDVQTIDRVIKALVRPIPIRGGRGDEEWVSIDDPNFNCMKYNLGYVNLVNGTVAYVTRRPARAQAQGLASQNVSVQYSHGIDQRHWGRADIWADLVRNQPGLGECLMGKYPSLDEARAKLMADKTVKAVAFDRYFAIKRHSEFSNLFFLNYKGEDISWSDSSEFSLPDGYKHLMEMCNEKGCLKAA